MSRTKFIFFSIFSVAGIIGLAWLGLWQLQRLEWKEGIIRSYKESAAMEPLLLDGSLRNTYESIPEYRRVRATGKFLHNQETILAPRYVGTTEGAEIITPFKLSDDTIIFVNRGFVPTAKIDREARKDFENLGVSLIEGVVRGDEKHSWWMPPNNVEERRIFSVKVENLPLGYKEGIQNLMLPLYIMQTDAPDVKKGKTTIIRTPSEPHFYNEHRQYAYTWFSLSLIVGIMYLFMLSRRFESDKP